MQRPGWIWAALPPGTHRVRSPDEPGFTAALREAGLEVVPAGLSSGDEAQPDAILVAHGEPDAVEKTIGGARTARVGVAAVAIGPDASPSVRPVSRPVRALQMLASPLTTVTTQTAARRLERAMKRGGLEVTRITTGNRSLPSYGLGPGGWLRRRRLPGGAIVVGSTEARPPSVIEEVVSQASRDLGRPLERVSADVFPSGKLAIELTDSAGESYFLSITAGDAGSLDRSESAIRAVLAADPPASLRRRIVAPLAAGTLGPVRYVLEPKAPGRHPVWMTAGLWERCVEILAELHHLPRRQPGLALPPMWPDLPTAVEILGREAREDERRLLERIHHVVDARVAGIDTGAGHGDFFTRNLLVGRDEVHAVLDWEWASRDALPLLDLFDLRAQLGWRRRRGLRVGQNFTHVLWPLAREGRDEPIKSYCRAVGLDADPRTLEGLAIAHWLLRTARLGSINPKRLEDTGWRQANVTAPMTAINAKALQISGEL